MVTMKDEDYDMVLDINLKGAFHMIRACYRDFMRKRSGKIINISSIAGLVGNVGQVNYAASKAGLIGLSKSVAKELGSRGVCCNCIAPGFIETAMTKDIKEDNPLLVQVPMRKMGTPEDVANFGPVFGLPRERLHHRGDHPRGRRAGYMRRVVVTGMGCVTPVGNDVPSFWESLKAGKCGIGPITTLTPRTTRPRWPPR